MGSFLSVEHKWPISSQGMITYEQKMITPKFYMQSISRRCLLAVQLKCPNLQYAEQTQPVLGKTRLLWGRNKVFLTLPWLDFIAACCEGGGTRTGISQGRCSVNKNISGGEWGCIGCGKQELEDKSLCMLLWGQ